MIHPSATEIVLNNWMDGKSVPAIQDQLAESGQHLEVAQIHGVIKKARDNRDPRAVRRTNAVYC